LTGKEDDYIDTWSNIAVKGYAAETSVLGEAKGTLQAEYEKIRDYNKRNELEPGDEGYKEMDPDKEYYRLEYNSLSRFIKTEQKYIESIEDPAEKEKEKSLSEDRIKVETEKLNDSYKEFLNK
jgi:predicted RNA-binding protein